MSEAGDKPVQFGRYTLLERIASGGMGSVHVARARGERGFSRPVAIKRLHPHLAEDREIVTRFIDEARVASQVKHPHVVSVLDVGDSEGSPFLVLDYVHGASFEWLLRAARQAGEPVPLDVVSAILCDVLEGLQAAHDAVDPTGAPLGIVHRDVSPHNILVSSQGAAYVTDFGIAKIKDRIRLTGTNDILGKAGYMSPEQLVGGPTSPAMDIFAAGIVLWEALAGRKLYEGLEQQMQATVERTAVTRPSEQRAEVTPELDALVSGMLSLDRTRRPRSALACAEMLAQAAPRASTARVSEWVLSHARERLDVLEEVLRSDPAQREPGAGEDRRDLAGGSIPEATETVTAVEPDTARMAGPSRGRRQAVVGLAVAALVAGAFALGLAFASGSRPSSSVAASARAATAQDVPPALSTSSAAPSASVADLSARAPNADADGPTLAHTAEPSAARPGSTASPSVRGTPRSRGPAPSVTQPSAACEPPYVVVEGIKHWKRECFASRGR